MEARMKMVEARISCSPPSRPWVAWLAGNAGDKIQISSGTVAMRLSVMEFGRFKGPRNFGAQGSRFYGLRDEVPGSDSRRERPNRTRADISILPHPGLEDQSLGQWVSLKSGEREVRRTKLAKTPS